MAPERWPQSTDQASREQFRAPPVMRGGVIMIYVEAENTKQWGNGNVYKFTLSTSIVLSIYAYLTS